MKNVKKSIGRAAIALTLTGFIVSTVSAQPGGPPAQPAPGSGSANPVPVENPPNGPGLGNQQPGPPQTRPVVTVRPPLVLNAKELAELKETEAEYDRFVKAATEHDTRMRVIAKREFDTRTGELTKRYADNIAKAEAARGKLHDDTIAKLEKFLINHPGHQQFTPDARFRLADLYLDRADDEVEAKLAAQEKIPIDPNGPPAPSVIADYQPALDQWEKILKEFPGYRQTPSTLYLLAYYGKTKDDRRSLQVFLALACANKFKWSDKPFAPPTRAEALKRVESKTLRDPYSDCQPYPNSDTELIRHAWVRGIADYHFTVPGEIDDGIAAYLKVAEGGKDSKLYAEALYKLAWSYYKRDRMPESIKRFDESVKLYDALVASGGTPALELRDESIQYISVAFTDPWEGETDTNAVRAFDRAKNFYKGRENEPHVRDVWVAMGKAFGDLQAWDQAVDAYRTALGPPWELHPKNPLVHQEIVNIYELKGDKFAADNAAAELAIRYQCPNTAWCQANEKDREAMETQRRMGERALYAAARNTHSAATQMRKEFDASKTKDPQQKNDYLAMYNKAVELYRAFIATYPESDYVYEFTYNSAEALYWSERYPEAIVAYTWIRDHRDIGTTFYIDAARSIVQTYEAETAKLVAEGKLAALKIPTSAELKATPQPWAPQPIPDVYRKLQGEYDNFQNIVNDPAAAPQQGTNAALISLAYFHIDDAIARFTKVMDKFCNLPQAAKAKDGILAIYEAQSNFDAIQRTNDKFIAAKCGDKGTIDAAIAQNRSLNFSRANLLFAENKYGQAAEAFYRFYKTAPPNDADLPIALYNAAVSYRLADKPKTAIALFKEFADNKAKNFRDSPFYLNAIGLQAAAYQAALDYDNAVRTYLELYTVTKKAKAAGLKPPAPIGNAKPRTLDEIMLDALYNAALASELNRDFKKAVELYTQYQGIEKDRRKLDRALWSIGNIYRQSGDVNGMEEAHQKWRARYGMDTGNNPDGSKYANADDYVSTYYESSQLRKKKGQAGLAKTAGQEVMKAWVKVGSPISGKAAKMAAEWELSFAEEHYTAKWEPYAIKTAARTLAEQETLGKRLEAEKEKAYKMYEALLKYQVAEYTMAAFVRAGNIQYEYGQKLADAPLPTPLVSKPDLAAAYQTKLDANVQKFRDAAKAEWLKVVDSAKKGGISNKWSRLAMESLGREFPGEFQSLRQELVQGTEAP